MSLLRKDTPNFWIDLLGWDQNCWPTRMTCTAALTEGFDFVDFVSFVVFVVFDLWVAALKLVH